MLHDTHQPNFPILQRTTFPQNQGNNHATPLHQHISPFMQELHEYNMLTTPKVPHLKVYNGTTCLDSHIDAYGWNM